MTIIALGGLLYPLLLREKYGENFSLGLVTSSGSLGLLFPPSLPLILYGLVAQVSVDKLFIAGIVPGLFMILIISTYAITRSPTRSSTAFNWPDAKSALTEAIWELPLPFIVLGGIYGGFFTVTEAASVTVVYVRGTAGSADAGDTARAGTRALITAIAVSTPIRRFIVENMFPPCWSFGSCRCEPTTPRRGSAPDGIKITDPGPPTVWTQRKAFVKPP